MLDGIAPIDWIEKLKAKIENPSDILPSIKKSNFTDYREPVPAIPDSEEEETLDDPMEIDFVIKKEPTTTIATRIENIVETKLLSQLHFGVRGVSAIAASPMRNYI